MVRLFIFVLFSLLIGAAFYALLGSEPGYLLLSWRGWAVETSLLMGVLLVLALFIVLLTLRQVLLLFRPLWHGSSPAHQQQAADRATLRGLRKLAHGHERAAYKELVESATQATSPLLNYLGALLAAGQLGNEADVHFTLRKAEGLAGDQQLPVGLIKAALLIRAGSLTSARTLLLQLYQHHGAKPVLLIMLRDVLLRLEDWDQLAKLLPALRTSPVQDEDDIKALRLQITIGRLRTFDTSSGLLESLEAIRDSLPRDQRRNERVMNVYIRQLLALDEHERAQAAIIHCLRNQWSNSLLRLSAYIEAPDPAPLRALLDKLLQEFPGNALLLLSLARVCIRQQSLETARRHLEAAVLLSSDEALGAEVKVELGRLLAHLGENDQSQAYYRQAMNYYARALPDFHSLPGFPGFSNQSGLSHSS